MRIEGFTHDPDRIDEFVRFGYELYRHDDRWIPPLAAEIRYQLDRGFEFFSQQANRHRLFLAVDGGRIVGRVAAMFNAQLHDAEGQPVATVGYFESVPDYRVAEQLLATAAAWLRENCAARKLWGPMNYDIWHGYRFMTGGFDQELFLGEPYNMPYYPDYFTGFGFRPLATWDSLEVAGRDELEHMITRGRQRYELLRQRGYRFRPFEPRHWDREVATLHRVLSASFARFPGFTAISPEEFARLFAAGRSGLHPELSCFVHNDAGDLAGFAAAFLDLGRAVRAMQGRTDLFARLRFLTARRRSDRVNFYIGGITPEEEARGTGLGRAGFYYVIQRALDLGYESLILSLRQIGNPSRALPGRSAPTPQRQYALYERDL
jgi:hypothetical protein